jgi:hypothetical protein
MIIEILWVLLILGIVLAPIVVSFRGRKPKPKKPTVVPPEMPGLNEGDTTFDDSLDEGNLVGADQEQELDEFQFTDFDDSPKN